MPRRLICWFRRDLRVHDNTALYHAARDAAEVIPVFVIDPALMEPPHGAAPRVTFLLQSLQELDDRLRRLGGYLLVRRGDPLPVLLDLLRESGSEGVYANRDYLPTGSQRDRRVREALDAEGYAFRDFADLLICEPDDLLTGSGRPYAVYTPYWRAWAARPTPQPLPPPDRPLATPPLHSEALPSPADLGLQTAAHIATGGETAGRRLLERFTAGVEAPIQAYATARNLPAEAGTSGLSPHLRFGTVSARTALATSRLSASATADGSAAKGPTVWAGELAWRDFYYAWMHHNPRVEREAFDRRYEALPFENDRDLFEAWCAGQTGYPIVDAGMRQLNSEGWMHNRLRMITASFLCKDLLVDWRLGCDYFWQHLTCGDKPANVGGWQWSASIGTDAQPYFRVFNPVTQGQRYDPTGAYVRRYVPELAALPDAYLHSPWTLPPLDGLRLGFVLGQSYPAPVVDHAERRLRAIEMFKKMRE